MSLIRHYLDYQPMFKYTHGRIVACVNYARYFLVLYLRYYRNLMRDRASHFAWCTLIYKAQIGQAHQDDTFRETLAPSSWARVQETRTQTWRIQT